MVIVDTLTISPVPSSRDGVNVYDCIGSIDANAAPVLTDFRTLLNGNDVLLNFNQVERVNSMGLSLLLKLFEESEADGVKIQVNNLNRMTGMLFRITGLGRFVQGSSDTASGDAAPVPDASRPEPPTHPAGSDSQASTAETGRSAGGTLRFVANLQTGQQLSGWYLLNTYLQRQLERPIHLEQPKLGDELVDEQVDLVFSRPFDTCSLIKSHGYVPLMRPQDGADEVVVLMRADDERGLDQLGRPRVSTVSKNSFVYILGRSLCDENGLESENFDYQFAGNEIKALQNLVKGKADVLFMLKKTYDGLSSFARGSTRLVDESSTHFAYHFLCIAPYLAEMNESLSEVLTGMQNHDQGRAILSDIQIQGWMQPDQGEIQMLNMLYDRYQ